MQEFYVYILKCNDGSYYVGYTDDIERRLNEHLLPTRKENGAFTYVSRRLPFTLVYAEGCPTRAEAQMAEKMIKGWGREKKELLISGGWEAIDKCWKIRNKR